jgi:tRNA isopentenyl-2-thiomethyl-A-37 hydroxylase MiaE
VYVDLARQLCPASAVSERLAELARAEAQILADPAPFVRLHT